MPSLSTKDLLGRLGRNKLGTAPLVTAVALMAALALSSSIKSQIEDILNSTDGASDQPADLKLNFSSNPPFTLTAEQPSRTYVFAEIDKTQLEQDKKPDSGVSAAAQATLRSGYYLSATLAGNSSDGKSGKKSLPKPPEIFNPQGLSPYAKQQKGGKH